jgi:hypothetical protein
MHHFEGSRLPLTLSALAAQVVASARMLVLKLSRARYLEPLLRSGFSLNFRHVLPLRNGLYTISRYKCK